MVYSPDCTLARGGISEETTGHARQRSLFFRDLRSRQEFELHPEDRQLMVPAAWRQAICASQMGVQLTLPRCSALLLL